MKRHLLVLFAACLLGESTAVARPSTPEERAALPPAAFDKQPISEQKSPTPTAAEWKDAPAVQLTRTGPAAKDCRAYRLREWLRVRCPTLQTSVISLLGGSPEGVAFWIDPPPNKDSVMPGGGEVLFPMRRGDRRVIQLGTFGEGYDGPLTVIPALLLQEQWADGAEAPVITAM